MIMLVKTPGSQMGSPATAEEGGEEVGGGRWMIIDRNEGANLWRRQLFWNNAQKNLSVTIMSDCLVNW